jgi:hypothetical protein
MRQACYCSSNWLGTEICRNFSKEIKEVEKRKTEQSLYFWKADNSSASNRFLEKGHIKA